MHYTRITNVEVLFNTVEHVTRTVTDRWLIKTLFTQMGLHYFYFYTHSLLQEVFTTVPINMIQLEFYELLS